MEQKQTILAELLELNSSLRPGISPAWQVPAGYFDNLAEELLLRVKLLDTSSVEEELSRLSPLLAQLDRRSPYLVPAGYFEELDPSFVWMDDELTARDEIGQLSPLLAGLQKKNPLSAPADYFNTLEQKEPVKETPVKSISLFRQSWFRYAAAAVIIGLIATSALLFSGGRTSIDPNEKSYAWVEKNMKKVGTETINEFVELTSSSQTVAQAEPSAEIKKLMQDISEKDIEKFLDDTTGEEPDSDDDLFLN
jgi:hypothetical protein